MSHNKVYKLGENYRKLAIYIGDDSNRLTCTRTVKTLPGTRREERYFEIIRVLKEEGIKPPTYIP
jgi:hypothetical protein